MTLLRWARLWVDHENVSTVAELHVAEAVWCTAIVDQDVVRLNVCGLIRNGMTSCLDGLHNTCMDITTAVKRF